MPACFMYTCAFLQIETSQLQMERLFNRSKSKITGTGPGKKEATLLRRRRTPYCIAIPPPNVTGRLHMGHGFQHAIMDALIRFHRMQGRQALWQVGTDHAGIATQMVVERQLASAGTNRHAVGRGDSSTKSGTGRRIRRDYYPAAQTYGFLAGLVQRAFHHGPAALTGGGESLHRSL